MRDFFFLLVYFEGFEECLVYSRCLKVVGLSEWFINIFLVFLVVGMFRIWEIRYFYLTIFAFRGRYLVLDKFFVFFKGFEYEV